MIRIQAFWRRAAGIGAGCIAAAFAAGSARADTVTFSDGDFFDWSGTEFTFNGAQSSSGPMQAGGNPATCWFQNTVLSSAPPPTEISAAIVFSLVDPLVFSFDPAIDGPIDQIDFQMDVHSAFVSGDVGYSLFLLQDAIYYIAEIGPGDLWDEVGNIMTWETRSYPMLLQSDFSLIATVYLGRAFADVADLVDPMQQPDFSATGSPISVGIFMEASSPLGGVAAPRASLHDNFRVDFVPEAPHAAGAFVALCTLGALRRRRSSA